MWKRNTPPPGDREGRPYGQGRTCDFAGNQWETIMQAEKTGMTESLFFVKILDFPG